MNGLPDTKLFISLAEIGIVAQTIPQMGNAIFASKKEERLSPEFKEAMAFTEDNLTRLANSSQYALGKFNSFKEEYLKQLSEAPTQG